MATDPAEQATETVEKKSKLPVILAFVAALLVGGAGGIYLEGFAPARAATAAEAADSTEGAAGEDTSMADTARTVYEIENLVLNPAGTQGTRFLMVSIGLDPTSEEALEAMKARDIELRDVVMRVLEKKTVVELSDVSRRDSLKAEIRVEVSKHLPADAVDRVFLPQFIIQ